MKPVAIISDLHSNVAALERVLEDIHAQDITDVICLGDVVGYGPDPETCIDMVRPLGFTLMGNHDEAVLSGDASDFNIRARRAVEWTRRRLREGLDRNAVQRERWAFLEGLQRVRQEGKATYVHGSPRDPIREYVVPRDAGNRDKMADIFARFPNVCFGGHTHLPGVFTERFEFLSPQDLCNVYILDSAKVLINVGSVGQPRDGDPRACYATFDGETVVWRRIAYDVEKTVRKIYQIEELDNFLGDRLKIGR